MLKSHAQRAASSIGVSSKGEDSCPETRSTGSPSGELNPGDSYPGIRGSFMGCLFQKGVLPWGLLLFTFLGGGGLLPGKFPILVASFLGAGWGGGGGGEVSSLQDLIVQLS